jgi:capsule polysaccharide export protein KpsC/LpsZ
MFFPLHVPGDSALTVMAPHCEHQEDVIEYIANRALPAGLMLYVKPHPAGRDTYPLPMLQRIKRLKNVRLIEPTVNSHHLIQGSRGLVVINSTAGFEGLLYQKPVVALGRGWYLGHGVTRDVPNLVELRHALAEALAHPPDRELVLRFVAAAWNASIPAKYLDPSPESVASLAGHFLAKTERLNHLAPGAVRPTA